MKRLTILLALLVLPPASLLGDGSAQRNTQLGPTSAVVLDINQATVDDLAALPGIGPKLAGQIVVYREKHGSFRRVEDLLVIRGIGLKKWKAIRPHVRVGPLPGKPGGQAVSSKPSAEK